MLDFDVQNNTNVDGAWILQRIITELMKLNWFCVHKIISMMPDDIITHPAISKFFYPERANSGFHVYLCDEVMAPASLEQIVV